MKKTTWYIIGGVAAVILIIALIMRHRKKQAIAAGAPGGIGQIKTIPVPPSGTGGIVAAEPAPAFGQLHTAEPEAYLAESNLFG